MEVAEGLDEEVYDLALSVYRKRACIELGIIPSRNEGSIKPPHEIIPELHDTIDARSLEIAYLKAKLAEKSGDGKALAARERTNLLNIIGALLELSGTKEAAIIAAIDEKYSDKPGLKERTLQGKFAEAKRSLLNT